MGEAFRELPPGGQQGRGQGDGPGNTVLGHRPAQRQVPHRPCTDVQQHRARLDQLLRPLLQVDVVSPPAAHQRAPGALGLPEVQTAAPTRKTSKGTPGPRRPALPGIVRSLALRPQTRWLDDGSRVSREASARFCERRGVRFPPPTHLVVLCHSQEQAGQVKARLAEWLAPRGLAFNEDKTRIVHLSEGFDFLGFNVRRYPSRKLLIKPSQAATRRVRERLASEMRALRGGNAMAVIARLGPVIRGWAACYRGVVSCKTFGSLDDYLWKLSYKWATWRHNNKPKRWIAGRYFGKYCKFRNDRWVFGDRDSGACLVKFSWTAIRRHVLVTGAASPDDPALAAYWAERRQRVKPPLDRYTLRLLARQDGRCPLCGDH